MCMSCKFGYADAIVEKCLGNRGFSTWKWQQWRRLPPRFPSNPTRRGHRRAKSQPDSMFDSINYLPATSENDFLEPNQNLMQPRELGRGSCRQDARTFGRQFTTSASPLGIIFPIFAYVI